MFTPHKHKRKAFTLVEVIIASLIFVGFLGGVFSLYNMGSRMYLSGSWKYNKQKEGERFLETLKERVEQSASPSKITRNSGLYNIETYDKTGFFLTKNNTVIELKNLSGKKFLAEFIIAKPDKTLATSSAGLILYSSLYCEPQPNGLATMCLYTDTKTDSTHFVSKAFSNYKFPPDNLSAFTAGYKFDAPVKDYNFPPMPNTIKLSDVVSIEINNAFNATSTADINNNAIRRRSALGFKVKMAHHKHQQTTLELKMLARIEPSVRFCPVEF